MAAAAKGISQVDGDYLRVTIPDWLADKLGIREGTVVNVDNTGGKLNILPTEYPPTN